MRVRVRRLMLALALAACSALGLAPEGGAAVKATPESYTALQKQIASGKVIKATVSPQNHTVKVKLSNAKTYSATFTPSQQAAVVASLKAKHAKVHVDKKKKKSSHLRYRYIALIVIAVALVIGLVYYLVRGRRRGGGPGQQPTVIEPGPSAGRPPA